MADKTEKMCPQHDWLCVVAVTVRTESEKGQEYAGCKRWRYRGWKNAEATAEGAAAAA